MADETKNSPGGNSGNNGFKLETAQFMGSVKAHLENIHGDVAEIKASIEKMTKSVDKLKWKVAAIGGTVSLIVTALCLLIRSALS
jgi:hypothetical protein